MLGEEPGYWQPEWRIPNADGGRGGGAGDREVWRKGDDQNTGWTEGKVDEVCVSLAAGPPG